VLRHVDRVIEAPPDRPQVAGPDHPMRKVTRQIAFEPGGWTPERREKVTQLFDALAADWHQRDVAGRHEALIDALDRAGPFNTTRPCVEVGSGVGIFTPDLTARFDTVVAVDLAAEMLRRAPTTTAPRVQADAAALPVADHSAGTVVLVNMFLFPAEVDRVLGANGSVVWVSALGDATPIYLPPEDVLHAMAQTGDWEGTTAEAGCGTWVVMRRR
jgi:Methyltransferase domain